MQMGLTEQIWNPPLITNMSLNRETNGVSWNPLKHHELASYGLTASRRDIINSEPVALGVIPSIIGANTISHNGVTIKRAGQGHIGIPTALSFTVDCAAFVAQDLIQFAGRDYFEKSEIVLVVQRTTVDPLTAGRPNFSRWHTHHDEIDPIDLTYQFSDGLPTEILHPEGYAITPETKTLVRMGGAITHRSNTNIGNEPVLRTWGAFIVHPHAQKPRNGAPGNPALRGDTLSDSPAPQSINCIFTPLVNPERLFETKRVTVGRIDPEEPNILVDKRLKDLFPDNRLCVIMPRETWPSYNHSNLSSAKVTLNAAESKILVTAFDLAGKTKEARAIPLQADQPENMRFQIQYALGQLGALTLSNGNCSGLTPPRL
ncbi:MAG: hypothetical protein GW903_06215 [Alphaproteobacteria bacterium]|nr:hypothetical protein [Alphaproteobacteria bacterium]NCQ88475.1 hypothetical protein [Alphaproteobacteria bacterium]